jgi:hypothetical protein
VGVAETTVGVGGRDAEGVSGLTTQQPITLDPTEDLIWHKKVPLKVSIFVWTLLPDRLPTKPNMATRGIITPRSHFCMSGCGGIESVHHLFISCSTFGSLWPLVRSWIDFSAVNSQNLSDHFLQFTYSLGGRRARRSFLQLIWLLCV